MADSSDTRTAAMAMAVGRSDCSDESRESAFGTCDVRVLLLPSHSREQVGGIPAIHYGTHDTVVYRTHLNSCNRSHICCYT